MHLDTDVDVSSERAVSLGILIAVIHKSKPEIILGTPQGPI